MSFICFSHFISCIFLYFFKKNIIILTNLLFIQPLIFET